ncbi:HNH endonuclease [Burkholderia gladioli]|uniref:HNH endonuclease n=1 Tax=Burkholderia gladioli TaxID=28095 RepID=UPI0018C87A36
MLVAEEALGRPLRNLGRGHPQTEIVHHVNGVRTDNRPVNLLVCTHEYHVALHHRLANSPAWPEFAPVSRPGFGVER